MNREILFRGKRVDDGEWVYGYLYQDGLIGCNIFQTKPHLAAYIVDPSTVCQYTGLTDKNGAKIFEGDILKLEQTGVVSVIFDDGMFGADIDGRGILPLRKSLFGESGQVIGNIFDNPEPLEEKQNGNC